MYKIITETLIEEKNGNPVVVASKSEIVQISIPPIIFEHKLNVSEKRYGIFTFGAKSSIAQYLQPPGSSITVKYKDDTYTATVHLTTKGRIDGLTALIRDNNKFFVGRSREYEYNPTTRTLTIGREFTT